MCSPGGKEGAWFADSCGGPGAQEPRDSWGHGAVAGRRPPGVCAYSAGPLAPGSTAALDLRKAAPRREKSGQEPPTLALESGGSTLEPMLPRWRGVKKKSLPANAERLKKCGLDSWLSKIPWRKEWQPTPVFLPGGSHGQRSLVGYSPCNSTESDSTEHARRPRQRQTLHLQEVHLMIPFLPLAQALLE